MNACVVLISCQLTQSYAPTAKTGGSFIKMSSSVELQPALPSFKSKVLKDFGFKVLYNAQGVRNVVKEIVICRHCFSELRYVSCIVSWHNVSSYTSYPKKMYRCSPIHDTSLLVHVEDRAPASTQTSQVTLLEMSKNALATLLPQEYRIISLM